MAPTGRNFIICDKTRIFRKSVEKIQVSLKSDKNNGTFHKDQYKFLVTSRSFLLRMRNLSDKSCRENQNTLLYSITFFESRAVSEMVWKNIIEQSRLQVTTWCTHIARWIPKVTNTLSEYVILIAVTLQ